MLSTARSSCREIKVNKILAAGQPKDRIVAFAGHPVTQRAEVFRQLQSSPPSANRRSPSAVAPNGSLSPTK